ncbi:MAG: AAA family ATPase [Dehalococcoidia bacterium]
MKDVFVGRQPELTSLTGLLNDEDHRTRSAIVTGEAGIGKSRLVVEFLDRAKLQGFRVLRGCCYRARQAGAYFPFIQVLSQLRLASPAVEFLEVMARDLLAGTDWSEASDEVRRHTGDFLRVLSDSILEQTSSGRTVLSLEDLHWADTGSLLLLNNLLDVPSSCLIIVGTARLEEAMSSERRQLLAAAQDKAASIRLCNLTVGDTRTLAAALSGRGSITSEEIDVLHSLTNGNALFVRELLKHLNDTGLLRRHRLPEAIRWGGTPERLAHAIDLRLCRLPHKVHRTLAACAVLGTDFATRFIAEATGDSEEVIATGIQEAAAEGIVRATDSLASPRFDFTHSLFASRIYDGLPLATRRRLHRNFARVEARDELTLADLARHYALGFGASGGKEAINACRLAAEQAEGILAFEAAAQCWEFALACTRTGAHSVRAELYRRLGLALWASGRWDSAIEAWTEAVRLFELLGKSQEVGEVAFRLAQIHRWRNEFADTQLWLGRALDSPLQAVDRARATALQASIAVRDRPEDALGMLSGADGLFEDSGRDPVVAFWLSQSFSTAGNPDRAHALAKAGFEEAQGRGAARTAALLAASLATHALCRLDMRAARTYVDVVQSAADPNDPPTLIRSLLSQAYLLGYTGRWRRLARSCGQWMAQVRLASPYQVATARLVWAEAQFALGEHGAAEREMLRVLPMKEIQAVVAIHLARVVLALGRSDEAAELVHRMSQVVLETPHAAAGRAVLGEVVSQLDMSKLQQRCYSALVKEERAVVMTYSPISVQRVLGRLSSSLRLWAKAREHFDTAVTQLAEGGARWELAMTYFDYAAMQRARRSRGFGGRAAALELLAAEQLRKLRIEPSRRNHHAELPALANRFSLTGRELEVLSMVSAGLRNQEIAASLTLSLRTVERHLENIFSKMGASNRTEAVILGVRVGLLGPAAGAG